jgi:hypothetical protein
VPTNLHDAAALDRTTRLMDRARQAEAEAGLPIEVRIGGRRFRYGFGF